MIFTLVPSRDKDEGYVITNQVREVLLSCGGQVHFDYEVPDDFRCDFYISIGGDGTFLRASERAIRTNTPILGINLGTTGFLAEVEKDDLALLKNLFSGAYKIEKRMLLMSKTMYNSTVVSSEIALNDISLHRGFNPTLLNLKIFSNSLPITQVRADGLIVSTPTGSTAYSLSAGGPIIDPNARCISMVPICSHSLENRAIVFDEASCITVYPQLKDGKKACVSVDGKDYSFIADDMHLEITKSNKKLDVVRMKNDSFYEILEKKMGGGPAL